MLDEILPLGAIVASIWGASVFVATSFWGLDEILSSSSKAKLIKVITGGKVSDLLRKIPDYIQLGTQKLFGPEFFTARECMVSSLLTAVFFAIVFLLWYGTDPEAVLVFISTLNSLDILQLFNYFVLFNIIPDYVSVVQTRIVVGLAKNANSLTYIIALMLLDTLATLLIAISPIFIISLAFNEAHIELYIDRFIDGLMLKSPHPWEAPLGLFTYTTFLTSIWIWVVVLASLVARVYVHFSHISRFLAIHLNFDQYPLRSIGVIGSFLTFISGISIFVLISILQIVGLI